jgi:hypothetical protein
MARTLPAHFLKYPVLLTCLVVLAGCETATGVSGGRAMVAVPTTAFYKYGPAQTFGPDFLLKQDTKVTVLKRDWAFTRVMTDEGTAGYIASEDLKAAPPEPPPSTSSPGGVRTSSRGKPRRSNVDSTPGSPLFDMTDLPALPPDELPKPAPEFRF